MDAQTADETALPSPDIREAAVYARLKDLGIAWKTHVHRAVFTVADSADVYATLKGAHTKNLFLKDHKGGLWLVCLRAEVPLDLKALAKTLGAPRFSFGASGLLIATLGIAPGAVNPFAVMNDAQGKVTVVLDEAMLQRDPVNFHPMRNDRTCEIAPKDLLRYLRAAGHEPVISAMPERAG